MEHRTSDNSFGVVSIKDHAIATIAGMAALSIPKVSGLRGNVLEDFIEIIWKKLPYKGVKVNLSGQEVSISLSIAVQYETNIAEVGADIQDRVKAKVEAMTGLNVIAVDVNVVSVS